MSGEAGSSHEHDRNAQLAAPRKRYHAAMIDPRWTVLAAASAVLLAASGPAYASEGPKRPGKCAVAGEIGAPSDGDAGTLAASLAGLLLAACAVTRRRR